MILAPDDATFAVMCLCLIAIMIKAGGSQLNDAVTRWWIGSKWK